MHVSVLELAYKQVFLDLININALYSNNILVLAIYEQYSILNIPAGFLLHSKGFQLTDFSEMVLFKSYSSAIYL